MPVYEYECRAHGVFEELRSLNERQLPAPCPQCRTDARRVVSVPALACMPRSQVVARDRNEQSRHEPRVSEGSGHRHASSAAPPEPGRAQVYHGPRPWVVEHA